MLAEHMKTAGAGVSISEREQKLIRDNFKVRERLRTALDAQKVAEEKGGKVKDGDVILTGDDAKHYAEFLKLGVALKDLPAQLTERTTLLTAKAEQDAEGVSEKAATLLEIPNVVAFRRLIKAEGLEVTITTEKVRGKGGKTEEQEVVNVRKRGAADTVKPELLADVLERDYVDDIPTLMSARGKSDDARDDDGNTLTLGRMAAEDDGEEEEGEPAPRGLSFPRTRSGAPSGRRADAKQQQAAVDRKASSGAYTA